MLVYFCFRKMRSARCEKRITQEQLAELCNCSDRYMRDLENGRKRQPSAAMVYLISRALGVSMEDLMETKEEI